MCVVNLHARLGGDQGGVMTRGEHVGDADVGVGRAADREPARWVFFRSSRPHRLLRLYRRPFVGRRTKLDRQPGALGVAEVDGGAVVQGHRHRLLRADEHPVAAVIVHRGPLPVGVAQDRVCARDRRVRNA
ncbi:hypothetical protein A5651_19605 [Mycobacterium sp. 1274761.0]|nr:hypothetical protein A5651_19605 [Mycobacterium sp. 1274761.0]